MRIPINFLRILKNYQNISELKSWNNRFYYGTNENPKGHLMMYYHNDEWFIAITCLDGFEDISTIPTDIQIIRLSDFYVKT